LIKREAEVDPGSGRVRQRAGAELGVSPPIVLPDEPHYLAGAVFLDFELIVVRRVLDTAEKADAAVQVLQVDQGLEGVVRPTAAADQAGPVGGARLGVDVADAVVQRLGLPGGRYPARRDGVPAAGVPLCESTGELPTAGCWCHRSVSHAGPWWPDALTNSGTVAPLVIWSWSPP